ncbi:hypothetical protein CSC17_5227 [Klebsiella oxytoca]|nr:hypothetical protein CSC17_5227 [Klebsiella oxytoca]
MKIRYTRISDALQTLPSIILHDNKHSWSKLLKNGVKKAACAGNARQARTLAIYSSTNVCASLNVFKNNLTKIAKTDDLNSFYSHDK